MKITPEHYAELEAAIKPLDKPEYRERYASGNYARADVTKDVNMRYRWDLYWFAVRQGNSLPDSTSGYNMDHIDTALRKIVPNVA